MSNLDIFELARKTMAMSDATWARHANPWSVYSRATGGTLVFFAFWSPFWLGLLGVPLILIAFLWIWLNPRIFPAPQHTETWATRGVLGERAYINRAEVPIPLHHRNAAFLTSGISGLCLLIVIFAFLERDFWLAVTAWHAATIAKLWFCDRMVWLWTDMKDATEQYRRWNAADW